MTDITSSRPPRVVVPARILAAIEAVRRDARVSMGDIEGVAQIAFLLGYPELEAWISANQSDYAHGIFVGFEAAPETAAA